MDVHNLQAQLPQKNNMFSRCMFSLQENHNFITFLFIFVLICSGLEDHNRSRMLESFSCTPATPACRLIHREWNNTCSWLMEHAHVPVEEAVCVLTIPDLIGVETYFCAGTADIGTGTIAFYA